MPLRRLRAIVRRSSLGLTALVVGLVGAGAALVLTPPGRAVLARAAGEQASRLLHGEVTVGSLGGTILGGVTLRDVVVRDTAGAEVLRAGRLRAEWRLLEVLAGRVVLRAVELDRAHLTVTERPAGGTSVEEVLGLRGPPGAGAPLLVELRDVTVREGAVTVRLQGRRVAVRALEATLPRVRLSSPARDPIRVEVATARAELDAPRLSVRELRGSLEVQGDSLRFAFPLVALPGTAGPVSGSLAWGGGRPGVAVAAAFDAARLDLADFAGFVPDVPALRGQGRVVARLERDGAVEARVRRLELVRGPSALAADGVVQRDGAGRVRAGDVQLRLSRFDLALLSPWVDVRPLVGTLDGRVALDGPMARLRTAAAVRFTDARLADRPASDATVAGVLRVGGAAQVAFDSLAILDADLALGTVRALLPALPLTGRLDLAGTLRGSWRDPAFAGEVRHRPAGAPASVVRGRLRVDARDEEPLVFADVRAEPVVLEGVLAGHPDLPLRGTFAGVVRAAGPPSALDVALDLAGAGGRVAGVAQLHLGDTLGVTGADLRVDSLDLGAGLARLPASRLAGRLRATLRRLPDGRVEGPLVLGLGPGTIAGVPLDSAYADVGFDGRAARTDSAFVLVPGGALTLVGHAALVADSASDVRARWTADRLVALDALAGRLLGASPDSLRQPLDGRGSGSARLAGTRDSLEATVLADLRDVRYEGARVATGDLFARWRGGERSLRARARLDTVQVAGREVHLVQGRVQGVGDSLAWTLDAAGARRFAVAAAGRFRPGVGDTLGVDAVTARVADRTWRLRAPVTLALGDSAPALSRLLLATDDGSGHVVALGRVPARAPGALRVEAAGVDLAVLNAGQVGDTLALSGRVNLALDVGGTGDFPIASGALSLEQTRAGDAASPFVAGSLAYADRILSVGLRFWRTGESLARLDARLPVDLAWGAPERLVDGPLAVLARADGADIGFLEALTPSVRRTAGRLDANVALRGTWQKPLLEGRVSVRDARATIPGIGVRYDSLAIAAVLEGDSVRLERARAVTGSGALDVRGAVRFRDLTRPELALQLRMERFQAFDVRGFLSLNGTGTLALAGPWDSATVSGRVTANRATYYFADLLSKRVIDLYDVDVRDVVDTLEVGQRTLEDVFRSRFLDRLTARDLLVTLGNDVWLRSNEANVKLRGDVRTEKRGRTYRLDGLLEAERGTYELRLGPVAREFTVEGGTVRLLGTPDLDGEVDLTAAYRVRSPRNEEIPILARITGTVLNPRLELTTGAGFQLSAADISSYLVTGQPATEDGLGLGGGRGGIGLVGENVAGILAAAVENAVSNVQLLGARVAEVRVRPGLESFGQGTAATSLTRLETGVQIGQRTFVTLNAGFCNVGGVFAQRSLFGAGIEYRFNPVWRVQASYEPAIQACFGTGASSFGGTVPRYQLGGDVFWRREF